MFNVRRVNVLQAEKKDMTVENRRNSGGHGSVLSVQSIAYLLSRGVNHLIELMLT